MYDVGCGGVCVGGGVGGTPTFSLLLGGKQQNAERAKECRKGRFVNLPSRQ